MAESELDKQIDDIVKSIKYALESVPETMLVGDDADEGYIQLATMLVLKLSQYGMYIIPRTKYDNMTLTIRNQIEEIRKCSQKTN